MVQVISRGPFLRSATLARSFGLPAVVRVATDRWHSPFVEPSSKDRVDSFEVDSPATLPGKKPLVLRCYFYARPAQCGVPGAMRS